MASFLYCFPNSYRSSIYCSSSLSPLRPGKSGNYDGTKRYDFWSRFWLLHSPFLFPLYLGGKRNGEWSSKNLDQKSYLSVPSATIAIVIVERAINLEKAIKKRSKELIPKYKIKSVNYRKSNREKFNNAITILDKITIW